MRLTARRFRGVANEPLFVRIAAVILARERQGLRPLVPETANRHPRVAG